MSGRMGSLPSGNFQIFHSFSEDVDFGAFGPSMDLEGVEGVLVGASEVPVKKEMSAEAKAAMVLKSHSEAERRRRERINSHLSTLRRIVPGTDKLDKAALLAEVISYVRALKIGAREIGKGCNVPADSDEVKVEVYGDGSNGSSFLIKASLCCEDRPELLAELKQTLQALPLRALSAEISLVGGRMKSIFVMAYEGSSDGVKRHLFANSIQQALKSVLERVSTSSDFSPSLLSIKRRRVASLESSSSCT